MGTCRDRAGSHARLRSNNLPHTSSYFHRLRCFLAVVCMATSMLSNILFELLDEPICNFTTYPPTTHNFHSTPPRNELEHLAEIRNAQQLAVRVQLAVYRRGTTTEQPTQTPRAYVAGTGTEER